MERVCRRSYEACVRASEDRAELAARLEEHLEAEVGVIDSSGLEGALGAHEWAEARAAARLAASGGVHGEPRGLVGASAEAARGLRSACASAEELRDRLRARSRAAGTARLEGASASEVPLPETVDLAARRASALEEACRRAESAVSAASAAADAWRAYGAARATWEVVEVLGSEVGGRVLTRLSGGWLWLSKWRAGLDGGSGGLFFPGIRAEAGTVEEDGVVNAAAGAVDELLVSVGPSWTIGAVGLACVLEGAAWSEAAAVGESMASVLGMRGVDGRACVGLMALDDGGEGEVLEWAVNVLTEWEGEEEEYVEGLSSFGGVGERLPLASISAGETMDDRKQAAAVYRNRAGDDDEEEDEETSLTSEYDGFLVFMGVQGPFPVEPAARIWRAVDQEAPSDMLERAEAVGTRGVRGVALEIPKWASKRPPVLVSGRGRLPSVGNVALRLIELTRVDLAAQILDAHTHYWAQYEQELRAYTAVILGEEQLACAESPLVVKAASVCPESWEMLAGANLPSSTESGLITLWKTVLGILPSADYSGGGDLRSTATKSKVDFLGGGDLRSTATKSKVDFLGGGDLRSTATKSKVDFLGGEDLRSSATKSVVNFPPHQKSLALQSLTTLLVSRGRTPEASAVLEHSIRAGIASRTTPWIDALLPILQQSSSTSFSFPPPPQDLQHSSPLHQPHLHPSSPHHPLPAPKTPTKTPFARGEQRRQAAAAAAAAVSDDDTDHTSEQESARDAVLLRSPVFSGTRKLVLASPSTALLLSRRPPPQKIHHPIPPSTLTKKSQQPTRYLPGLVGPASPPPLAFFKAPPSTAAKHDTVHLPKTPAAPKHKSPDPTLQNNNPLPSPKGFMFRKPLRQRRKQ